MANNPTSLLPASDHISLKARFKNRCAPGDLTRQNWQIRMHRSISWLRNAGECPATMPEAKFLFLWISFNSLYSCWESERNMPTNDTEARRHLLHALFRSEGHKAPAELLRQSRGLVKKILENQYLSPIFWRDPSNPKAGGWAAQDAHHLDRNLKDGLHREVLDQALERLFVFRGQIVHGASTSGSKLNRQTLRYCLQFLEILLPVIIHVVVEHHRDDHWPELCYAPQRPAGTRKT